jgi:hypothetical protein
MVGEPEGKNHLKNPRHRRSDNIKIMLNRVRICGLNSCGSRISLPLSFLKSDSAPRGYSVSFMSKLLCRMGLTS